MRKHLTNAVYGVLDYASYPFGMLLAAPIVLRKLGASEYGLWMIATAIISAGGIIASGFCDANIQRVARLRSSGETRSVMDTVRSIMGINLVLGFTIAVSVWIAAPFAASHITASSTTPARECLICIRIAGVLILVRAVESVGVSTHRAFEQYRGTTQISTAVRLLTAHFRRRTGALWPPYREHPPGDGGLSGGGHLLAAPGHAHASWTCGPMAKV